jgi:hypothetical protein
MHLTYGDPRRQSNEVGGFAFNDLRPGRKYMIREAPRDGWQQTAPKDGFYDLYLNSGQQFTGQDFGNHDLPPTVDLIDVAPDPRNTPVDAITIVFSKPVISNLGGGFDLTDLTLTRTGGPNLLGSGQTLLTTDNRTWILGNLTDLTRPAGDYLLTLKAVGSAIQDAEGTALADGATESWSVDPQGFIASPGSVYSFSGPASDRTLNVMAGIVTFNSDIARVYPTNLTLNVAPGAPSLAATSRRSPASIAGAPPMVIMNSSQDLASLNLSGGGSVVVASAATHAARYHLVLGSLAIDTTSTLDLGDNDLIVKAGGISAIEALVARGFNNGDWKGKGLTSSTAAGDPLFTTALGTAAAGDIGLSTFDTENVAVTDVLVKYTYYGDADLSGSVNGDDESLVLFGLRQGGASHWAFGDFDYSTHVTGDDYSLFLAGLRKQPVL